ncbi:MAG: hypothetical protein EBY17_26820 [Acidobacteriia bacterium]|nr:hypothetical protein [Terriglobia bacterium]
MFRLAFHDGCPCSLHCKLERPHRDDIIPVSRTVFRKNCRAHFADEFFRTLRRQACLKTKRFQFPGFAFVYFEIIGEPGLDFLFVSIFNRTLACGAAQYIFQVESAGDAPATARAHSEIME